MNLEDVDRVRCIRTIGVVHRVIHHLTVYLIIDGSTSIQFIVE